MTEPLRVLVCIPHFCRRVDAPAERQGAENGSAADPIAVRAQVFGYCLEHLVAQLRPLRFVLGASGAPHPGIGEVAMDLVQPVASRTVGAVYVNTVRDNNLLDHIPRGFVRAYLCDTNPRLLGYRCRTRFAEEIDNYDLFCFVEDDTAILDPQFFPKVKAFYDRFGEDCVILPSRYELTGRHEPYRSHLDGPPMTLHRVPTRQDAPPELVADGFTGPVKFALTDAVMSGCYVLTAGQVRRWMAQEDFWAPVPELQRRGFDTLEMTQVPLMGALPIYRPAHDNLDFLEVHHVPNRLSMARTPLGRIAAILEAHSAEGAAP